MASKSASMTASAILAQQDFLDSDDEEYEIETGGENFPLFMGAHFRATPDGKDLTPARSQDYLPPSAVRKPGDAHRPGEHTSGIDLTSMLGSEDSSMPEKRRTQNKTASKIQDARYAALKNKVAGDITPGKAKVLRSEQSTLAGSSSAPVVPTPDAATKSKLEEERKALEEAEAQRQAIAQQRQKQEEEALAEKERKEAAQAQLQREREAVAEAESQHRELMERRKQIEKQQQDELSAIEESKNESLRRMEAEIQAEEEKLKQFEELRARKAKIQKMRLEAEKAAREENMRALDEETQELQRLADLEAERSQKAAALKAQIEEGQKQGVSVAALKAEVERERPREETPERKRILGGRSLCEMMESDTPNEGGDPTRTIYPLTEGENEQTDADEAFRESAKMSMADGYEAEEGAYGEHEEQDSEEQFFDAAAEGHVTTLAALIAEDQDLLYATNSEGRNALFVACANDQVECAQFLLTRAPGLHSGKDQNGDCALHAAASTGALGCLRLLLANAQVNVDSENALGMRAAHMVQNEKCLEMLVARDAEICCEDHQQRTPLFVACAMNREDCARYLCELIDAHGVDHELTHCDRRGDTPLHAAACNGADKCLRLLLEWGVDPDSRNNKTYRPIDLAARRGHAHCEKLLNEYQLHHQSGGYLDSVFFLASVQGQKARDAALESVSNSDEEYEIIQKANPDLSDEEIKKRRELWEARRTKSVKLQQWGSWIAFEDTSVGTVFWYNHSTQQSQWEKPEQVQQLQSAKVQEAKDEWNALMKTSIRLKNIGEWIEYHGKGGQTFYYNEKTGEHQWERPLEMAATASQADLAAASSQDWAPYKDPNTGMRFWYNHVTGESQWHTPEGYADDDRSVQPYDDSNEVYEVADDLDNLGI